MTLPPSAERRMSKNADPTMTAWAPASSRSCARPTDRTPPPTRQGSRAATSRTSASLVPDAHRRVEIDQLNFGKLGEALDPAVEIVRLDGELLALNELNDLAALEIDRWNQHCVGYGARKHGNLTRSTDRTDLWHARLFEIASAEFCASLCPCSS